MPRFTIKLNRFCIMLGGIILCMSVSAEQTHLDDWIAVEPSVLDELRGGFAGVDGLKISFGIERTVSINGNFVSATNFNMQNGGQFTAGQTGTTALSPGAVVLIQNGPGNTFQPGQLSQTAAATFIQNSLNNQTIKSTTIINATTNSLELLKNMNLGSALHDALTNAAGVR